jgi:hypothetical protein
LGDFRPPLGVLFRAGAVGMGVAATVTPLHGDPVPTIIIPDGVRELVGEAGGARVPLGEYRRTFALRLDHVPAVPRGTTIRITEPGWHGGDEARDWVVDGEADRDDQVVTVVAQRAPAGAPA